MPLGLRRLPKTEEVFVLGGAVAFVAAAVELVRWRFLLLEYFYFTPLLALTHLVTLGFLSSLMMGMLYRLSPMLLGVEAWSSKLAAVQLLLFLVGAWGMISHFWMAEWTGMSWSAGLVWAASLVQIWNFRALFRPSRKPPWPRRFVASSLVHFFLAASLGVVLGIMKAYGVRPSFLAERHLANVFAHAHLAGVGWVLAMIFGFQLKLVPTTEGNSRSLPVRFALLHAGTLGLAGARLRVVAGLDVGLESGVSTIDPESVKPKATNVWFHQRAVIGYRFAKRFRIFTGGGFRAPIAIDEGSHAFRPDFTGGFEF